MSVTFSEAEVKKLILALAGSKAMVETPEADEAKESPEHEADPKDKAEDKAEGEQDDAGKPHESSKEMLVRKLKEKGSK